MTKPKRYKRYSAEFRREAILRAAEEGVTDKSVCDELGVTTRQFLPWRDELLSKMMVQKMAAGAKYAYAPDDIARELDGEIDRETIRKAYDFRHPKPKGN